MFLFKNIHIFNNSYIYYIIINMLFYFLNTVYMNLFRKIAASVALAALVVSTTATSVSAYSAAELTAANGLAAANVINDHTADPANYNLDSLVLRQEAAKVAVNIDSTVSVKTTCDNEFADITATTPNNWVCGYAEALLDAGKVSANTNFNPETNVTKSEATKMMLEAAGCTNVYTNVNNWQAEVVNFASTNNIIDSFTDYNTPATRGFVFQVAYNAMNSCPIEEEECSELMQTLGICTVDNNTNTNTGSTNTGTTNTGTTNNTTAKIALSSDNVAGADVPSNVSGVEVMKFDITAWDEDATINAITLKRVGLGASSAVNSVVLFSDNERVSKAKNFNSTTDIAEVNITPALVVKAGETKTITAKVATGGSGKFAVEVTGVNSNVDFGTVMLKSEQFEIVSVTTTTVTIDPDGSVSNPKLGEDQAELLKFKVKNGGQANEDVTLTSITFKDASSNIDTDVENFTLYNNGQAISTVASVDGKYVTFNLDTPFTIKEDKTEKFVVKGDIVAGAADTIDLYIDNVLDVTVKSPKNEYATVVENLVSGSPLTIQAGQVTIIDTDPENDTVLDNKDNVVFGTFKVKATTGKDLYIDSVAYNLAVSTGVLNADLENVELYDATNGVSYDPTTPVWANANQTFSFTDLDIPVANGGEVEFQIRADVKNGATAWHKITATVNVATNVVVKEALDDKPVTDKIPSSISFDSVEIVAADMAINPLVESDTSKVIGSKDVEAFKFEVRANNDASTLTVKELTFKGNATDNSAGGANVNLDNTRVNAIHLYKWTELLLSKSASELSNGEITFDGLNEVVAKNDAQEFTVKLDILDDVNNAADTITLGLVGYVVEDSESDNVYLTNDSDKDGRLDDEIWLADTNTNGLKDLYESNRTITIKGVGTLATTVDNTDSETDKDKNVLGWTISPFVASFELVAVNEKIKIVDLQINEKTAGKNLKDGVAEVVIYANDKTTELARQIVTSDSVLFNNINAVIPEGTSNIYVKVVTHKIGKDEPWSQVDDLTLEMLITDAKWDESQKSVDVTSMDQAGEVGDSKKFSVVPVRISNVAFVNSQGGETVSSSLTNGENTIGIIAITTDSSDNTNSTNGSALKTLLKDFKVTLNTDAVYDDTTANAADITAITVQKVNGITAAQSATLANGNALPGPAAWGTAVTGINLFNNVNLGTDKEVENGTTVYYVVKATLAGLDSTENKYVQLKLENLDTPNTVIYSSDEAGAANITSLRIGTTSIDGTTLSSSY